MNARILTGVVELQGTGLFTGASANFSIHPGPSGSGVWFSRKDVPGAGRVQATIAQVPRPGTGPLAKLPSRNTILAEPPACFFVTVEHVMSALAGLSISDVEVRMTGPELPIFDGSAEPMAGPLHRASTPGSRPGDPIILRSPVRVTDEKGATISATPRSSAGCGYTYRLDYGPAMPSLNQSAAWDSAAPSAADAYLRDIAPARTFCLQAEAQALRAAGLFAHVTPAEMLVIAEDGTPIDNAFRFADEPARHKLLDLIGDVALLGRPLQADIVSTRGGHALTHQFCRAVLASLA